MNLRYKFLRMLVKQKKNKMANGTESHTQQLAYEIIKKGISNSKAELLLAPISNVYYIKMDNLFIKVLDNHVQIVNGKYFYHISMPDLLMNDIDRRFRNRIESKKKVIENKITDNTNSSLRNIFNDLNYEKITNPSSNEFKAR
jgi:DNA-binding protein Fis